MSAAVALENLNIFEEEKLNEHVRENSPIFRATLEKLKDLPIVGDVRGDGYFFGIELVKDKATKATFDDDESERLLRGFLSKALFEAGPVLPRRRPRRPRRAARSAAHDRPEGVRRDRGHPARRAVRGLDPALTTDARAAGVEISPPRWRPGPSSWMAGSAPCSTRAATT